MRYTETKVYDIQRQGRYECRLCSQKCIKEGQQKADRWCSALPSESRKEFSMGYLSGFVAENRDMEKDGFVNEVKEEVMAVCTIQPKQPDREFIPASRCERIRWILPKKPGAALLPVWTVTYK